MAYSDGVDACTLMEGYGFTPDPWQARVVDAWCARTADDRPSFLTMGLAVPRQNGKNGVIEVYEFYKLLVCGEGILHTAHQVKTANKSFQRLAAMFTDPAHPEVGAMVRNIRRTNGEQGIYLENGAFIEYSARSRGASRGNTYSVVVYDEAQELTDEQVEALMPTLAASPTGYRQLVYTGTPPGPSSPGTVFRRLRRSFLDSPPKASAWHEWSVDALPPATSTFSDLAGQVLETNPAMGIRLDMDYTEQEFSTMSIDGFARERLGWWGDVDSITDPKVDPVAWAALAIDPMDAPEGKRAYGVKFSPDGSEVALCGATVAPGGAAHVELIATATMADGTEWIADYLNGVGPDGLPRPETIAAVAVDGKRGLDPLMVRLRPEWPRQALMVPGTRGVIAAAAMLAEGVEEGTLTHPDDPGQAPLNDSVRTSPERTIGRDGGWSFGGDHATAVEAAAIALWAATTTRRDPDGGCVVL